MTVISFKEVLSINCEASFSLSFSFYGISFVLSIRPSISVIPSTVCRSSVLVLCKLLVGNYASYSIRAYIYWIYTKIRSNNTYF